MRAVLAGEPGAWERLAEPHRAHVRAVVGRFVTNGADAEDLTQEIMLRAYRKLARFKRECAFSTWLHAIAVRCCLDHQRRPTVPTVPLEAVEWIAPTPGTVGDTEELAIQRLQVEHLLDKVDRLPAQFKAPLLLVSVLGLSMEETARELGCSLGTVKSRLHRARAIMRERGWDTLTIRKTIPAPRRGCAP